MAFFTTLSPTGCHHTRKKLLKPKGPFMGCSLIVWQLERVSLLCDNRKGFWNLMSKTWDLTGLRCEHHHYRTVCWLQGWLMPSFYRSDYISRVGIEQMGWLYATADQYCVRCKESRGTSQRFHVCQVKKKQKKTMTRLKSSVCYPHECQENSLV